MFIKYLRLLIDQVRSLVYVPGLGCLSMRLDRLVIGKLLFSCACMGLPRHRRGALDIALPPPHITQVAHVHGVLLGVVVRAAKDDQLIACGILSSNHLQMAQVPQFDQQTQLTTSRLSRLCRPEGY